VHVVFRRGDGTDLDILLRARCLWNRESQMRSRASGMAANRVEASEGGREKDIPLYTTLEDIRENNGPGVQGFQCSLEQCSTIV
jgi:hypothetical protein